MLKYTNTLDTNLHIYIPTYIYASITMSIIIRMN